MNEAHLRLCSSPEWARYVEDELIPWALEGRDLGDSVVEVGSGPGLTTDVLLQKTPRLTAVEIDRPLAAALATRLAGRNVTVVHADATALPFETGCFSAATSLTMLHHVPTSELQDRLLAELCRVLRPGGVLVGTDGTDTPARRELHTGDIFVPVQPDTLARRLEAAGFHDATVDVAGDRVRFVATRA